MMKLLIFWIRLGPYHMARLRSARKLLKQFAWDTSGMEICPNDNVYDWQVISPSDNAPFESIFPHARYNDIPLVPKLSSMTARLNTLNPDAVAITGWSMPEALAALYWAKKHRKFTILMSESKSDDSPRNPLCELIKRIIARNYDAALVGGTLHKEYAVQLGIPESRVFTGYDVVDNQFFFNGADKARANEEKTRTRLGLPVKYMLAVSRFVKDKNLNRMIEAYKIYSRKVAPNNKLPLVICGSGILENQLKQAAGDTGDIIWAGFKQIDELPSFYGLASAFIIPSIVEPWGLVVNEAMACGLPILASNTIGCRNELIINNVNGLYFDPYSIMSMSECMINFSALDAATVSAMSLSSLKIISDWGPDRFARMMHKALERI
jgi:glycosyltransferase involved in cell wall biosynthesis